MVAQVIKTAKVENRSYTMCLTDWAEFIHEKFDIPRGSFDWMYRQKYKCDLQLMINSVATPKSKWKAKNQFLYGRKLC